MKMFVPQKNMNLYTSLMQVLFNLTFQFKQPLDLTPLVLKC